MSKCAVADRVVPEGYSDRLYNEDLAFREGRIVSRPIGKLVKPGNRRDERLRKGA